MKIDMALETMKNDDYFKAIEYLSRQSDPLEILDAFKEIAKQLYWDSKDMAGVIIISGAAIQFAQMSVQNTSVKEDVARQMKEKAAAIAYNLASYTWPGWNKEGLEISIVEQKIGMEAAKTNLRFIEEMGSAHRLTLNNPDEAIYCFERSLKYADWADNREETLLAQGYMILAQMLQSEKVGAQDLELLENLKKKMVELPDGDGFVGQIETTYNVVFGSTE
jgi:tetratricopeptide (TPR) repeat protein